MTAPELPEVSGRLSVSLAALVLRARTLLADEQQKPNPDNALIDLLCNTVRLARETAEMIGEPIDRALLGAIVEAIRNEGRWPPEHRAIMARHRQEWPTLWAALDRVLESRAVHLDSLIEAAERPLLILMEPTQELTQMQGCPVRVWEGETLDGIKLFAMIARIAVAADKDQTAFQRALHESAPPKPLAIDIRLLT